MDWNKKSEETAPGLERLCKRDWIRSAPVQQGVARIEAYFSGEAYAPHRHDTYSIGYTMAGVQSFDYRGARQDSTAGRVMVLHPDEVHNGRAGTESGFRYQMVYVEPALLRQAFGSSRIALPFVKDAVFTDTRLLAAVRAAFETSSAALEPVHFDHLVTVIADCLLAHDRSAGRRRKELIDPKALSRAQAFLAANFDRVVGSNELEAETGLDRFSLARQFRAGFGTSPYRYLTMRRLERVRTDILAGKSLADAAVTAGFSDQAHMTRHFTSAYGVPPGRWRALHKR